jgi:serine/threonine protein kinase
MTTIGGRGTPCYRAPELVNLDGPLHYNNKVDIFAMGCILFELTSGKRAFRNDFAVHQYSESRTLTLPLDDGQQLPGNVWTPLNAMLNVDGSSRPTASALKVEFSTNRETALHAVEEAQVNDLTGGMNHLSLQISGERLLRAPSNSRTGRDQQEAQRDASTLWTESDDSNWIRRRETRIFSPSRGVSIQHVERRDAGFDGNNSMNVQIGVGNVVGVGNIVIVNNPGSYDNVRQLDTIQPDYKQSVVVKGTDDRDIKVIVDIFARSRALAEDVGFVIHTDDVLYLSVPFHRQRNAYSRRMKVHDPTRS